MPRVLVVFCSAIVLTGAIVVAVFGRSGPGLAPEREQAVRTAVENHLEQNHWRGVLASRNPEQSARWFCAGEVIEADENPDRTTAGMQILCEEYVAVAGELVLGSGESIPVFATVTSPPGPVEVLSVENPHDGEGYSDWIHAHFSWLGVKKVLRPQIAHLQDKTISKARTAFGLPANAPVRPRS